jgi:hypothetical protein
MDAVVAWAGRWEALRLGDYILEQLEEAVEHCGLVAADGVEVICGRDVYARGAEATPEDTMALMPKCHACHQNPTRLVLACEGM